MIGFGLIFGYSDQRVKTGVFAVG